MYNPPYSLAKPTAFNLEVETHLKATFKANYTWKPPTRKDIAYFTIKTNKTLIGHQSTMKLNSPPQSWNKLIPLSYEDI